MRVLQYMLGDRLKSNTAALSIATIVSFNQFYCRRTPLYLELIDALSFYAKPTKKLTHKDPRWTREGMFLSSVQSLYVVELKLPLRIRLARQTHARRMPNS